MAYAKILQVMSDAMMANLPDDFPNPMRPFLDSTGKMGAPMSWEEIARFLWDRLDDIDTASDIAKGHTEVYNAMVRAAHVRRFEVATTDGYAVDFNVK